MPQTPAGTRGALDCSRYGCPVRWTGPGSPRARLLRRAQTPQGWCAGCSLTGFLRNTAPLSTLVEDNPTKLLDSRVQQQIAGLLHAGHADADVAEIDWPGVVQHWDLPL